ncbi:hypothetical protein C4K88_12985 [Arthrobacter pityocampae]|uniref:STAS/SEC14 domain-containing protein n=2 Tax=Arthrobacter pityocampae TaxID=547334 RepID=A0A2S5IVS4_9MICC|nr:hypothetical protein C4K88_12985 [Arthrobacter pityocampae]
MVLSLGSGDHTLEAPLHQIDLGTPARSRVCPGPGHAPRARRHCAGMHCIEVHDGLLVLWWVSGARVNAPDVLAAYEGIRSLSDGYVLPMVMYLRGLAGIDPAARLVILEGSLTSRIAFVGSGPVDQVLAAFLAHARSETLYSESVSDAEAWARGVSSCNG